MEAEFDTHAAPAPFHPVAIPNTAEMKNDFAIEIPYLGGLIATRSFCLLYTSCTYCNVFDIKHIFKSIKTESS